MAKPQRIAVVTNSRSRRPRVLNEPVTPATARYYVESTDNAAEGDWYRFDNILLYSDVGDSEQTLTFTYKQGHWDSRLRECRLRS